jgi:hypothetical protein
MDIYNLGRPSYCGCTGAILLVRAAAVMAKGGIMIPHNRTKAAVVIGRVKWFDPRAIPNANESRYHESIWILPGMDESRCTGVTLSRPCPKRRRTWLLRGKRLAQVKPSATSSLRLLGILRHVADGRGHVCRCDAVRGSGLTHLRRHAVSDSEQNRPTFHHASVH